jgi:hypothetical protein
MTLCDTKWEPKKYTEYYPILTSSDPSPGQWAERTGHYHATHDVLVLCTLLKHTCQSLAYPSVLSDIPVTGIRRIAHPWPILYLTPSALLWLATGHVWSPATCTPYSRPLYPTKLHNPLSHALLHTSTFWNLPPTHWHDHKMQLKQQCIHPKSSNRITDTS